MVTRCRRKVITQDVSDRLRQLFVSYGKNYKVTVDAWNYEADHIHVLYRAEPKTEMTKFLNAFKSASSWLIKVEFPEMQSELWNGRFRSPSCLLLTTGDDPSEFIKKYIETQEETVGESEEETED